MRALNEIVRGEEEEEEVEKKSVRERERRMRVVCEPSGCCIVSRQARRRE